MHFLLIIILAFGLTACDGKPGPDSITSHGGFQPGAPSCDCHSAAIGARRQVLGNGGDFASNPTVTSHHVAGADPTPDQCLVCHDLSLHGAGTVLLRHADTGVTIGYDPASPSTLEPFCLSCHDADGAVSTATSTLAPLSPFGDGATLGTMPYAAGTTISASWSGSSTHRSKGLTCAGTGQPDTGCHGTVSTATGTSMINMHGSTVRGLLTNTMNFQIPLATQAVYSADPLGSSYDYNNYRLCFDCHENYSTVSKEVVLGFLTGGVYDNFVDNLFVARSPFNVQQQSRFRDHYDSLLPPGWYNENMWGYPWLALHNYHLIGFESKSTIVPAGVNALQWKYRGDPNRIGRITCTACHNVHGTAVPTIGSTHEELQLTGFTSGVDGYVTLGTLGTPSMTAHPLNCAVDCHTPAGQTSYWHTPSGE